MSGLRDNSDDIDGYSNAVNNLQSAASFFDEEGVSLFEALLEKIIADAKSNLQNNQSIRTGSLIASIDVLDRFGDLDAVVGTNLEYGWYVEYGRGIVKPIHAKALHWIDKDTGEDVFAKSAGPSEPMPFLEPAVLANTEGWSEIVVKRWSELANASGR